VEEEFLRTYQRKYLWVWSLMLAMTFSWAALMHIRCPAVRYKYRINSCPWPE
jgi:hypothetical protein